MINKKMFKSAAVITAVMLSVSGCAGGCSKQAEPVIADSAAETPEPEESIESSEPIPSPTVESTEEPEGEASEEFTLTEMDIQMVVNTEAYTYENPTNESTMIGAAQKDELVHVIGQVDGTNWFKIEQGNGETDDIIASFIDGEFLSEYTAPAEETPAETETPSESETPAETETPSETQQPSGGSSGGNGGSSNGNGNSGGSGGGNSQPTEPTLPPAQDEPQWNVGDVMGENESGANDMIYGGHFSDF